MATATNATASKVVVKEQKPKKEPKPLLTRLDEQLTRAAVQKKVTHEELARFEIRVGRLKTFLEE